MSPSLFGRYANCIIAPINGTPGLDVSNLRIVFEAEKTSTSEANKATVKIYNLSKASRSRIRKKEQAIILNAGYTDIHSVAVSGVIHRIEHSRDGVDIVSMMEIRDGGLGLDAGEFRRSYPAGTQKSTIIGDILATMPDISRGPMVATGISGATTSNLHFSGASRAALDKLARAWRFEWSVQDGSAQFLDRSKAVTPDMLAVYLSPDTGLIGCPTRTDKGAKFESLLMPHIRPGVLIDLQSEFVTSVMKALTVKLTGDTHGADWKNEIEAKDLLGKPTQHLKFKKKK